MITRGAVLAFVATVGAQGVGDLQYEIHPKLSWTRCESPGDCANVEAEVVTDPVWRWIHEKGSGNYINCYAGNEWDYDICPDTETCTEKCVLEGVDYKSQHGITTNGTTLTQPFLKYQDFFTIVNSRLYLLEQEDKYQTFTLMDNELAFDIDLSSVECGINAALYFVEMEADGGMARFPTNTAGPKYGTGYCDAACAQNSRFVGGKANNEQWTPSATDPVNGQGWYGACCSEFDVWNSNAHSYSMSSKLCKNDGYHVCELPDCVPYESDPIVPPLCDRLGCDYNPYRLGTTEFYGQGKSVDTSRKFTVVTRFEDTGVSQYFIQHGEKIEAPSPAYPDFPNTNRLNGDYCEALSANFGTRDLYSELGGFSAQNELLRRPMVMVLAITNDHWGHNLWLDSIFPPDMEGLPGAKRGDCFPADNEPQTVELLWPKAQAVWSNIRFGPIGSTVVS